MGKFFKFGCLGIIAIIVIIIIIAVASGGGDESSESGKKVGESKAEETKQEETKTFAVGDTIDLNGLEITIADAKYIDASEYSPAEKGKVLQMNVNVTNNKEDTAFIDSTDFNLYDTDGNSLDYYYGGDSLDLSGDVNAGKKLSGTLTFDVPESDSYEMIFEPTFSWTDEQITWDIKPE
ncbi:DUF4352 domain-containing protein [Terribacillus sp. JSM ZJ617]|uniref:DUF4352 domain-containing protein n=1 Tax=Terribacillus sp. JSM ZJ617 TaxID=3342119 RepID=UPI0035A85D9D